MKMASPTTKTIIPAFITRINNLENDTLGRVVSMALRQQVVTAVMAGNRRVAWFGRILTRMVRQRR